MGSRQVVLGDLIKQVANITAQDETEVHITILTFVRCVTQQLRTGSTVKLRGLGTLFWKPRKESRRMLNGKEVIVPDKQVLKIRPSTQLRDTWKS